MCLLSLIAFCTLAISGMAAKGTGSTAKDTVKLYQPNGTIGENITVQVVAMYDSNFTLLKNQNESSGVQQTQEKPIETYFQKLFQQVQGVLNNMSIMINITVTSVYEMDNLTEYTDKKPIVKVNKTLENIIHFGDFQNKSGSTVFFLFLWPSDEANPSRLLEHIKEKHTHRLGVSEAATNGTFCSKETSAALIRHKYGSYNPWSTEKAILTVFGAKHFLMLRKEDYTEMNKTFSRCLQNTGDGAFLGC